MPRLVVCWRMECGCRISLVPIILFRLQLTRRSELQEHCKLSIRVKICSHDLCGIRLNLFVSAQNIKVCKLYFDTSLLGTNLTVAQATTALIG